MNDTPDATMRALLRLGPVRAELAGPADLVAPLATEVTAAPLRESCESADLHVHVGPISTRRDTVVPVAHRSRFPFTHAAAVGGDELAYELRVKGGAALYRMGLTLPFNPPGAWHVTLQLPRAGHRAGRLADTCARLLSRDGSCLSEVMAKNVVDETLDPLLWLRLLRRGGVLAHGGAVVTPDGGGILLLGAGGAGKTRTVLQLVARDGWRFLGEDRTALVGGRLHRHPKHVRISGYQTTELPGGDHAVLAGRSRGDLALWAARSALLGRGRVGRRMAPERVFGESKVVDDAPLSAVVLLQVDPTGPGLRETVIDVEDLSGRAASMVCNQFWDVMRGLSLLSAASAETVPSVARLHARTAAAFADSLAGVPLHRLLVPPGTSTTQVAHAVLAAAA